MWCELGKRHRAVTEQCACGDRGMRWVALLRDRGMRAG
jgi:hypothetical protein